MGYRTCGQCGVMYPYIGKYFKRDYSGHLQETCKRCSRKKILLKF